MKSVATIKLKIPNNKILINSMKQYSKSVSYISDQGYKNKIHNRYNLHHLSYYKARNKFKLPSQYIINAIRIASQTLKSVKTNKGSKPFYKELMPVDFDRRTFTFFPNKIRLTTIKGRIDIPVEIPEYYNKYLSWRYQTCRLIYNKKQNKLFLHIAFSRETNFTKTKNPKFTGIDLGINNIAVTSDKKFFNSSKIKKTKIKFKYIRSRLQSKGTKSSKKLLKKISGREKRFMRQNNHEISKKIVSSVKPGDIIVMEKLKGIRRAKVRKKQRYWLNSWSFYQLQKYIEYKAVKIGAKVIYVNPRNTSKTCSRCFSMNTTRKSSYFHCLNCSYHLNADLNASYNIKFLGRFLITKADVNQPEPFKKSLGKNGIFSGAQDIPSVDCEAILRN